MDKIWTDASWEEFEYWKDQDERILAKILQLIKDIDRNGYSGIGHPEPLKGNFAGYWSRRIDEKNRLIYKIEGGNILIIQCGSHYGDK